MEDLMNDLKVELTQVVKAPRDRVFDAWLDPKMLTRFMAPAPNMSVPRAETDPREGGRFLVVMRAGDTDMPHEGTYTVIDRPNRLAFTWESPHSTVEGSTVTLDFTEVPGGTEIHLVHVLFRDEGSRNGHEGGWRSILAELAKAM